MIKYRLACTKGHDFEGWFRSSEACDAQMARGTVTCPVCGDVKVAKAPMAPSVAKRARRQQADRTESTRVDATRRDAARRDAPLADAATPEAARPGTPARRRIPAEVLQVLREMRRDVEQNTENVGRRFAEEARRMHYKESAARPIHGEATLEEANDLAEEGIGFLPLPRLPEDNN